jgi:hypothetical protein
MLRTWKSYFLTAILAGIVVVGAAPSAHAQFRIRVDDGGTTGVVITDNAAGDADATLGRIVFFGSVGAFTFTIEAAQSDPIVPLVGSAYSQIENHLIATASGPGTLRVTFEDNSYTNPPSGPVIAQATIGGNITSGTGSITAQSWIDTSNAYIALGPDTGPPAGMLAAIGATPGTSATIFNPAFTFSVGAPGEPGGFNGLSSINANVTGPYALFGQVIIVAGSGGISISADETQKTLPAPGGLVLALTALPFGLGYLRRRLKKTA